MQLTYITKYILVFKKIFFVPVTLSGDFKFYLWGLVHNMYDIYNK